LNLAMCGACQAGDVNIGGALQTNCVSDPATSHGHLNLSHASTESFPSLHSNDPVGER
jgi:hypothetical protein